MLKNNLFIVLKIFVYYYEVNYQTVEMVHEMLGKTHYTAVIFCGLSLSLLRLYAAPPTPAWLSEKQVWASEKEAASNEPQAMPAKKATDYKALLEAKIAAFFPIHSKVRRIYDTAIPMCGVEANIKTYKGLYRYMNASYLWASGHAIGSKDRTHVQLVPLGVGLKFIYDLKPLSMYVSAGPLLSYIHMKDSSPYVIRKSYKWSWGGNGKVGLLFFPLKHFLIDVFVDYSYMKFDFHNGHHKVVRTDVDFSGWSIGAAVGYAF